MFSPNYWRVLCSALRTDVFRRQTGTAKQLEALCSCTKLLEVLCSADVFFNTWRPCVPDYKLLEVLCSATDRHTPFSRKRSVRF